MITILVTDDEIKVKEALTKLFSQEGYSFSEEMGQDNVIRLVKKNCIGDLAFIKDKVVELENSLFTVFIFPLISVMAMASGADSIRFSSNAFSVLI